MNKEEYDKLNTYDKIDYDIQMKLFDEYNDIIATMNDHLGEIYGYSDLKEMEDLEKNEELRLYKQALKEKCIIIDKAIEYIESKENGKCIKNGIEKGAYTFVLDFDKAREFIWELLEILKGEE